MAKREREKESKRKREKESKRKREKESMRKRQKESKRKREKESKRQRGRWDIKGDSCMKVTNYVVSTLSNSISINTFFLILFLL